MNLGSPGKHTRKIIATAMMMVGSWGTYTKHSDNNSRYLYNTMTTIVKPEHINKTSNTSTRTTTLNLQQTLSQQKSAEDLALAEYREHSIPMADYETPAEMLTQMFELRIANTLHPEQRIPSNVDEYPARVLDQIGKDMCLTITFGQIKGANIRSSPTWKVFGMTGKKVRTIDKELIKAGRFYSTGQGDKTSNYTDRDPSQSLYPHHQDKLLSTLHTLPANSLLLVRYTNSPNRTKSKAVNKNATHSMRTLGSIHQWFHMTDQLQVDKEFFETLSDHDKKVHLIWNLMYQRSQGVTHTTTFEQDKKRISSLLTQYPELLQVSRKDNIAYFYGPKVQHEINGINYVDYAFNTFAYSGKAHDADGNKDGSVFFPGDVLTYTSSRDTTQSEISATKYASYHRQTPLYKEIIDLRKPLTEKSFMYSTYIVNFDDIDLNGNDKIDKHDKPIHEVIEEMTTICHKNNGQKHGLSKKQTQEYISRYLTILGAMDRFPTGTAIPLPDLTPENRAIIDKLYPLYKEKLNDLRILSQEKYFEYLKTNSIPTLDSKSSLQRDGLMIYPICSGDDELAITRQICTWISFLPGHQSDIDLSNITLEEYSNIYAYIKEALNLPKIEPGRKVIISLPHILHDLAPYLTEQKQLSTNLLPVPPHPVIGQFADVMKKLDIDESTSTITQQYLLRETSGDISSRDIASSQFGKDIKLHTWIGRGWAKMMAEKLDFDDRLSGLIPITSQGSLQLRLNYFIEGENHKLPWIIQASQSLIDNKKLNLSDNQKADLQEVIDLSKELLNEKNKQDKDSTKISQGESKLLHILSDMVNFDNHSLEHPEEDIGTLLSLKLTSYQIQKYRWKYAQKLKTSLNQESLSNEQVAFIQQFCLIANHLGEKDASQARNSIIGFYQTEKKQNPDYSLLSVFDEDKLIRYIEYVRALPPHNDKESTIARAIIAILGLIFYPGTFSKLNTIISKHK